LRAIESSGFDNSFFEHFQSPPGVVAQAVKDAIDAGYRHIDGAHVYQNEHEVGEGINTKINEGVIKREDIFVTSKLWNTHHESKDVRPAIEYTLKQLNLSYVDLYLIHWPFAYQKSDDCFPRDANGKILHTRVDLLETYREMEKLVDAGLTKSIGVSNFNISQIEYIVKNARIQPVMNQVELHPYLLNKKLSEYCRSRNILMTAYSPLGSPARPWVKADDRVLLNEPKLLEIAKKYNKQPAQILIRFQMQLGNIVIPKSVTKERIINNFEVFDFALNDAEMSDLQSFGYVERVCPMFDDTQHPDYPFNDEA
jgi:aldehyde reductase